MYSRYTRLAQWVLAAILISLWFTAFPTAFAQAVAEAKPDTVLTVGWGDMVVQFAKQAFEIILPLATTAVLAAAARLPWWVTMFLTTQRIDRALRTGADYAINAIEGAVAGKALSKDVGYIALKVGLERILGSTPEWIIKEMGGSKGIVERLFRVFHFDETVSNKNTLQKVIDELPSLPYVRDA